MIVFPRKFKTDQLASARVFILIFTENLTGNIFENQKFEVQLAVFEVQLTTTKKDEIKACQSQ